MTEKLNEMTLTERRRLARRLTLELLGPIAGKMPKSSIESLEKASYQRNIAEHIADIIPVTDAAIVKHEIDGSFPPFFRREAVFAKRNLYVLHDAVVSPQSGMVWIENKILEESVGSLRRIMDWGRMLHEPLLPVQELHIPEPVVVSPPVSYYHWLLEVLPNLLYVISRFPDVKIVLPDDCPGYVTDGLTTALGSEASARFISCRHPIRVGTLIMPQYHTLPEFTNPQSVEVLRDSVKAKVVTGGSAVAGNGCGEKIYISRRRSRRRRLAGEDVLEKRLERKGFRIVQCEELSFGEQVRLFHGAATVVATHGAGLSNLVWSEAPCTVVEIFAKNYILDCFAWLSFGLGFDYRFAICSTGHRIDERTIDAVVEMV